MNREIEKLTFVLALSGLSEKEILTALREVDRYGPKDIAKLAIHIRKTARSRIPDLEYHEQATHIYGYPRTLGQSFANTKTPEEDREIIVLIENLLRREAGLSAIAAATKLSKSLRLQDVAASKIPEFRTKDGFRFWLKRLSREIPPNILVHHATKVRNAMTHSTQGDWPLRKRDN